MPLFVFSATTIKVGDPGVTKNHMGWRRASSRDAAYADFVRKVLTLDGYAIIEVLEDEIPDEGGTEPSMATERGTWYMNFLEHPAFQPKDYQ